MLKIQVKYQDTTIIDILYPADSFTVGFQNEVIATISGTQTLRLNIKDQYCSQNIQIANQILDNKDQIFKDCVYIYSTVTSAEANRYIEFYSTNNFSLLATKEWSHTIYYSRDLLKWEIWDGGELNSKQFGSNYYLYLRGTWGTKLTTTAWTLSAAANCRGNLIDLLSYNAATISLDNNAFKNWMKNQPIQSIPSLENFELAESCFESAFENCTNLTTVPQLPYTEIPKAAFKNMFKGAGITQLPCLPGNFIGESAYESMFEGTNIKLSTVQSDEYPYEYSIPTYGDTKTDTNWNLNMFKSTQGAFVDDPTVAVTYYTNIQPTRDYHIIYFNANNGTGVQPDIIGDGDCVLNRCYYHRNDYNFAGWGRSASDINLTPSYESIYIYQDTCLYPHWWPALYPVNDLQCEFLFRDFVEDSSDNGVTISNYNFSTTGGRKNGCLILDTMGQLSLQTCGAYDWSVAFWVYGNSSIETATSNVVYFGEHDSLLANDTIQFILQAKNSDKLQYRIGENLVDLTLNAGLWNFIVFTQDYSNNKINVYINGNKQTYNTSLNSSTNLIFKDGTAFNQIKIDDLRIYHQCISDEDISNLAIHT